VRGKGEFSEVRGSNLPRPQWYRVGGERRLAPSPALMLRLLQECDTSCCDLLRPGLPKNFQREAPTLDRRTMAYNPAPVQEGGHKSLTVCKTRAFE
jgi:hypothetical protein